LPIERGGTAQHKAARVEPSRGDRRPTLKTIAQLTGLGITTVSRALKNGPELSVATRARVREVAHQLGYRPHRAGVRLRTGRTYVIGLILDQNNTVAEFEKRIILGVSRVLAQTNYHLVVMPLMQNADLMEPIRYFVETAAADGLIFTHTQPRDERVRYLLERDFPFICHGRTKLDEPHPFYDFDNERFTVDAVNRLRERGRKRLLLVAPLPNLTCSGHMREGFYRAIADAGVEGEVLAGVHLDSDPAEFRLEAKRLASGPNAPDGIICANETRSLALVAGLQDGGLTVGKDIDVIGKDTSDLLDHVTPSIDSFYEDLIFAGEELARLLLIRIAGATLDKLQTIAEPRFHRRT
jgi:LacI family transcriptional regulator